MNIINNPNYTCTTDKRNPYLDTITFKPAATALARQMQISFLIDRLSCVTSAVPYILTVGDGKPTAFYTQIMNEVANNPKKYNCTQQELRTSYGVTFEIINAIGAYYNKNRNVNEFIFKYGVTVLNDKFFEAASNGRLNYILFVDGMKKMGEDLYKYKKTYNILG